MERRAVIETIRPSFSAKRGAPEFLGYNPLAPGWMSITAALNELYGNWADQLKVGTIDRTRLIGAIVDEYKDGYTRAPSAKLPIATKIGTKLGIPRLEVLKAIGFLEGVTKEKYPNAAAYMSPEGASLATMAQGIAVSKQNAVASVKEGLQDTKNEFIATVKEGVTGLANIGPWYARPVVVMPILLGIAAIFYFDKIKAFLPKKKSQSFLKNPISKKQAAAAAMYEKFSALPAKKRRAIPAIDTEEMATLGGALDLSYRSNKWTGKPENYIHKFGKGVKVHVTGDGKALVITGGKMIMTDRGIEN